MIDDVSDIIGMYDRDPEYEDQRLIRHQLERDMTLRYLAEYLPAQGSILEIGAATGRYTAELARRGYEITAVDLSQRLVERCRTRMATEGLRHRVRHVIADARDLAVLGRDRFDAVLLMGPLYHLVEVEDRRAALGEAYRHLKPGGILFSSWISRLGILGDLLKDHPQWIENRVEVRGILDGGLNPENRREGGFRGYFARISELAPVHEEVGFETLGIAAVEPGISADDESYNRLQGDQRRLWLDLLYEISQEPSVVGASRHILYLGRRAARP